MSSPLQLVVAWNWFAMKSVLKNVGYMVVTFGLAPVTCLAASSGAETARNFVSAINKAILYPLIALMIGVALLVFLYGAFEFVRGADNDSEREKGKQHLLWGTVGLLVMVSAMAILSIAANTFKLGDELDDAKPKGARTL